VNRQSLKWLPNALSASRGILALPVYITAVQGQWVVGFWLLMLALLTDFLDGLAAKKLQAQSVIGGHIDRVSDWTLSFAGAMGLIVGAQVLSLWLLVVALPLSAFIGYIKFFTPEGTRVYRLTSVFSVIILFITWSFIVWGYLWQAFGWSWLYPPITIVLLAIAARLKKHRLKAWFGWLVAKKQTISSKTRE
jgi:phosphatidylglycerophosphate synthase